MNSLDLSRYALGACACVTLLAGCGGLQPNDAQPSLGEANAITQSRAIGAALQSPHFPFALVKPATALHRDRGTSWIAPDAKKQNLLYISDGGADDVKVYSYPADKLVGTLKGFQDPAGECNDAAGDVWIVNSQSLSVDEYAHAGKKPEAKLSDTGGAFLLGCSVDPTTGNLAVTDLGTATAPGSVLIYTGAQGTPKAYQNSALQYAYFCVYDSAGNLFVDGVNSNYAFQFLELPSGSKTLQTVTLNQNVDFPGGLAWDGEYVAVGDQDYGDQHTSAIYQVSVSASGGTIEGTTLLTGSCDVLQFGILNAGGKKKKAAQGAAVAGPDVCEDNVGFYSYPAGGSPTGTLTGFQYPVAVAPSFVK